MIDFTYDSYRALLTHIRGCGHTICPLRDVPSAGRYVILRHDIDYSVHRAVEMAGLEHEMGVTASVFLMLASPYYNLLDRDNLRAARSIADLGHEIGFHYDTEVLDGLTPAQQAEDVARQAEFLSQTLGTPITSVAQHNPSMTNTRVRLSQLRDAYDPRYFSEISYLSDSRRLFRMPDVHAFFSRHDQCQLLIHPVWWGDRSKSRQEVFAALRTAALASLDERLSNIAAVFDADERALGMR